MRDNRRVTGFRLILVLVSVCLWQSSGAEESKTPFKYSDEWSLVSAPPPAGPYQPVNIDPRVPGPGTVPQVPMAIPRLQAVQEMTAADRPDAHTDAAMPEQAAVEASADTSLEEPVMPPVSSADEPEMPPVAGDMDAEPAMFDTEPAAQASTTLPQTLPADEAGMAAGQETPAVPETADAADVEMEQAPVEQAATAVPDEPAAVPPAPPGHYAPVVQELAGDAAGETASPMATTLPQEQPAEPAVAAGHEMPAVPATADADVEQRSVEQAAVAAPGDATAMPPAPRSDTPVLPLTASDELPVSEQEETAAAGMPESSTGTMTGLDETVLPPTAAGPGAAEQESPRVGEPAGYPPAVRQRADIPADREPATAYRDQPFMPSPGAGYYDRMPPPAAGRAMREPPAGRPTDEMKEEGYGYPAERASRPGYSGYEDYYGRRMPSAPGYNYPAPSRYPYQTGRPGYWNMPPYAAPGGQEWSEDENVPPPPVYDSRQHPGSPIPGYR